MRKAIWFPLFFLLACSSAWATTETGKKGNTYDNLPGSLISGDDEWLLWDTSASNFKNVLSSELLNYLDRNYQGVNGRPLATAYRQWVASPVNGDQSSTALAGGIAWCVAQIGSTDNVELVFPPGDYSISSNLTIPSNIVISPQPGCSINVASGKTLTIGKLSSAAGRYQWISNSSSGSIILTNCGSVYPEWFGALADSDGTHESGTDNASAFAEALSCASNSGLPLRIGPGIFRIASGISMTIESGKALDIIGCGLGSSTIYMDFDTSENGLTITGNSSSLSRMSLSGFTLSRYNTGVIRSHPLLDISYAVNFSISNMELTGSSGFSARITNSSYGDIHDNIVHDTVINTGGDGIHIEYGCSYINIHDNTIFNTGDDAIGLFPDSYGTITNISVCNNIIYNVKQSGIKVGNGCSDISIIGNIIDTSKDAGIFVLSHYLAGASTEETSNIKICDNLIANTGTITRRGAIQVSVGDPIGLVTGQASISGITINGNTIHNSNGSGILLGTYSSNIASQSLSNIVVSGNVVDTAGIGHYTNAAIHVYYYSSGGPTINNIKIIGNASSGSSRGLLIHSPGGALSVSNIIANNNIFDSVVGDPAGGFAIQVQDVSGVELNGNKLSNIYGGGIYISGCDGLLNINSNFVESWNGENDATNSAFQVASCVSTAKLIATNNQAMDEQNTPTYSFALNGVTPKAMIHNNVTNSSASTAIPTAGSYSATPFISM